MDRPKPDRAVNMASSTESPPFREIRRDPILGRWVIVASERSQRPNDFAIRQEAPSGVVCPFCHGSEAHTPPEVYALRDPGQRPNTPGWRVRVVPNKYPALRIEGDMGRRGVGMYDQMNAIGAHEVVIESPEHTALLSDLDAWEVGEVLRAYRERILDLEKDARLRYILVFKNQGAEAGATLEHTHTQIIATPVVPKRVSEEIEGARNHFKLHERCVFCDIIRQETESQVRVVRENDLFIVLEPFASRFPFETWIFPKKHSSRFEVLTDGELRNLGDILRSTLAQIHHALDAPPYNYVLHTAPCHDRDVDEYFHWHLEIMPKLTRVAGFEWGSGFYINPMPPETATTILREAALEITSD